MRRMDYAAAGVLLALLIEGGCAKQAEPDAYGNVEATEVVVGAEATGRLETYTIDEGAVVKAGAVVGAIDATQLGFERDQLAAQRTAAKSRVNEVRQQIAALEAQHGSAVAQRDAAKAQREALSTQLEIAGRAYQRTRRLFDEQAATAQQLDQTERDERVLGNQIGAQDEQIKAQERQIAAQADLVSGARAQEQTAAAQVAGAEAQVSQAGERIRKTEVRNPVDGTVLASYAKAGEVVQAGQPLYRVANLASIEVRAYVTEPQLAAIRLGQEARVSLDTGSGQRQSVSGSISWIASRAEFTPTPIQTREERVDLVYAIKIRVANANGVLKIGMPVDVQFVANQAAR
ncbi:MAG TPA: HlyD family efflux transporter periplasmic adaptor subunit [Vicinamibacterales bacterium]|nr:HlyD family efflux transporter periplasmic adaptor subunit [Vicinamibacterales bacterium]